MAFRYDGKNWEKREFSCPPSIRSLGDQVDVDHPDRKKGMKNSDGTVARKEHDAGSPKSEHRPTPHQGAGVVRAIDVTASTEIGDRITEALRLSRDPRIMYVIWNRRKFDPPKWEWRRYKGTNPHETHFHVSTLAAEDDNADPWSLGGHMPLDDADKKLITEIVRTELAAALGPEANWTSVDGKPRRGYRTMIDSAWWPKTEGSAPVELLIDAAQPKEVDPAAIAEAVLASLKPELATAIAEEVARKLGEAG